jgi:recombinational DNA repair protein (RecF pathway)
MYQAAASHIQALLAAAASAKPLLLLLLVSLLETAGWGCIVLCCKGSPAFQSCMCAVLQTLYRSG